VTNYYEPNRDILDIKQNKAGTNIVSRYDYLVNAIGQRSNLAQTGTAFASSRDIAWGYDSLGQVTRADSTIPGLDRAYAFDMIGNRLRAATGSIDPNDPAAATYTPNALNQYSQITNNSITNNPAFDADGNMTSGALPANVNANSTLVWDGENRLIQATVGTTGSVVRYSYDSQSRRIAETVGTTTKLTIYDGWNPIAEYAIQNSTFTIQNSYLWGIDLSGSMQGAGGVGGLLMTSLITNNSITSNYFPTYDGNGNVSEYLNESGEVSAHYEYDPFGKTTVATGPKANDFAHRFSTKPLDATTGLYYYGYRYYDPNTGRWPSRDPIGEKGGVNLYGFVGNNGVNWIDVLGLSKCPEGECCESGSCVEDPCKKGGTLVRLGSIALRLQLIERLLDRRHGGPGGSIWNLHPNHSCYNQSVDMLGGLGESAGLDVPECWSCELEGGSKLLGADHFWVRCKAKNCQDEIVDTLVLDYWAAGDADKHKEYPNPPDPTSYPDPIIGPRPPCGHKWR
jgi:RHS repeat-associated protein